MLAPEATAAERIARRDATVEALRRIEADQPRQMRERAERAERQHQAEIARLDRWVEDQERMVTPAEMPRASSLFALAPSEHGRCYRSPWTSDG